MNLILAKNLENKILTNLKWVEVNRNGPKEFFGKKPDEKLDPEYFIEKDGTPRIPADIGDAFKYELKTPVVSCTFGQYYHNTIPLSTCQFLTFYFGKMSNLDGSYDSALGGVEGFEFLEQGKLGFTSGLHSTPDSVSLESQNLGIHKEDYFSYRKTFNSRGEKLMKYLLDNQNKLTEIKGLKGEDKETLKELLDKIEGTYTSGTLEPQGWFYT